MNTPVGRRLGRLAAVMAIAPLALLGACAGEDALNADSGSSGSSGGSGGGEVVVAGQNFSEMQIMTEMYAALLRDAGYDVTVKLVESRDVYAPQMEKGAVDVSADYLSSMTEYLNKQENGPDAPVVASPDTDATLAKLKELAAPRGIEPLQPAEAEDANAFAVTKEFAEKNDLKTLSDLAALNQPVTLAAAEDCSQRTDCEIGLEKTYGLDITKVVPLGFGTTGTKDALAKGEVDLGQVGTSDATLDQLGLVILEDDQNLQNAENLVPMVNSDFLKAHPDVADVLNEMSSQLTTEDLATMIGKVDLERQLPEDVATSYLQDQGLL
ncbi:ABC transporter substrate-binding protein [Nocardioides mesophilus]|uniref:ABC transporter substrate-binding protein n=2 Tax=Nocardioides mesophilus TaxID=433659 RepID=A0A7G9RHB2_9ACTN|nr:ABC transporter substrate-binding protein [Nocardioides mesophilus]